MRIVVLASGSGTNLQALIDAAGARGSLPGVRVAAVISDKPEAFALERARRAGIPAVALPFTRGTPRPAYDGALASAVADYRPDFVLLLGWMRILTSAFLARFPGAVVNLHPALPGTFPGTHSIERALAAFKNGEIAATGVMTHFVPDEGVDSGPVISLTTVAIMPDDDLASLEARVHDAEHALVVETVRSLYILRMREGKDSTTR
jgi:phosphoribosylglycinamide formyltransferase-1